MIVSSPARITWDTHVVILQVPEAGIDTELDSFLHDVVGMGMGLVPWEGWISSSSGFELANSLGSGCNRCC
jgi:hypothetical protein